MKDADSGITFATVNLNQEQTCQSLSRLSNTHCVIEVFGLENVGKLQEHEEFVFEIPKEIFKTQSTPLNQACLKELKKLGMEEWKPDNYYGSQNSFFDKGDKRYARTIIRRWI